MPFTPVPEVQLPFQFVIITHHEEARSKNTGVQAAILSSKWVKLQSFKELKSIDSGASAVLFPSDGAIPVRHFDPSQVSTFYIIDSKWKKAKELSSNPPLSGVQHVRLQETRSAFWRFHTAGVSDEGVCTIEAIYFLLKALQESGKLKGDAYKGPHCFDNLLWYFAYQHKVVEAAFTKRRLENPTGASHTPDQGKKRRCIDNGTKMNSSGQDSMSRVSGIDSAKEKWAEDSLPNTSTHPNGKGKDVPPPAEITRQV